MYFKKKRSIELSYERQGLIYFLCVNYNKLSAELQRHIHNICLEVGAEYYAALFELVTTTASVTAISSKHYTSPETMYRLLRKFYKSIDKSLKLTIKEEASNIK